MESTRHNIIRLALTVVKNVGPSRPSNSVFLRSENHYMRHLESVRVFFHARLTPRLL